MARLSVTYVCVILVVVNSFAVHAAPSRERRSPTYGLARAAAGAIFGVPAAVLATPAVALGEASYNPSYGDGFSGSGAFGPGYAPGAYGPGNARPSNEGGLPGISFSSSKSFSTGNGAAQSSTSSSAGGYGK